MSVTSVTQINRLRLWVLAGGRCEYRGCNKSLWRDDKTLRWMNKAYIAHIVADSPDGPRGDPVRSLALANDLGNLMLLCDDDHRRIDIVDVDGHPESLLLDFKREHEERIVTLTGIDPDLRTHVLTFVANIGLRKPVVNLRDAQQTVVPMRHPDPRLLEIDLTRLSVSDADALYWPQMRSETEKQFDSLLHPAIGAKHISVFALAPIPILVVLGRRLGDLAEVDVFQKFREGHPWQWRATGGQRWTRRDAKNRVGNEVAIALSASGKVQTTAIHRALASKVPVYRLGINKTGRDKVCTAQMLSQFRGKWRALLTDLRSTHGENCRAHVFPAVPNSVAVEIGRTTLPKSDPRLEIWDHQIDKGGWVHAITL